MAYHTGLPPCLSSKESACNQETRVQSLGEDPLEKRMATHSSVLAWRIPWAEEPGWLQSKGSQRVRLSEFHFLFSVWIYGEVKSFLCIFVNASYR